MYIFTESSALTAWDTNNYLISYSSMVQLATKGDFYTVTVCLSFFVLSHSVFLLQKNSSVFIE